MSTQLDQGMDSTKSHDHPTTTGRDLKITTFDDADNFSSPRDRQEANFDPPKLLPHHRGTHSEDVGQ